MRREHRTWKVEWFFLTLTKVGVVLYIGLQSPRAEVSQACVTTNIKVTYMQGTLSSLGNTILSICYHSHFSFADAEDIFPGFVSPPVILNAQMMFAIM